MVLHLLPILIKELQVMPGGIDPTIHAARVALVAEYLCI